jgi:hypothetical protein
MKALRALIILLIGLTPKGIITAQTPEVKKVLHPTEYKHIKAFSGVDVYIQKGTVNTIEIVCPKEHITKIIAQVVNDVLVIRSTEQVRWERTKQPRVYVTYTNIHSLEASGGADVYSMNQLEFETFYITANRGADIYLTLKATSLTVIANQGAGIKLSGTTQLLKAYAYGGSDLHAGALTAARCHATSSGGSEMIVKATDELVADAIENSHIGYIGTPLVLEISETGGSDIYRK